MSDSATYRKTAEDLMAQALRAADPIERGRLIGVAAHWHMLATQLERPGASGPDDPGLGLSAQDPDPSPGDDA